MPACGDSHESAASDSIGLMEEMASVLEGIESSDDVEAAAEELLELGEEIAEIQKRMADLGKPTAEQDKELAKKFEKRANEAMKRLLKAGMKAAKYPGIQKAFAEAMSKINAK